jgi:hypothetical protein
VRNCRIEYGGAYYGDIYINDCTPTVFGDSIGHSLHYGIYLAGTHYPDPAELRANNTIHDYVDGDINIPSGIEECPKRRPLCGKLEPTILPGASGVKRPASSVAFDAMGRRVANPRSGIFFVQERSAVSGEPSAVTVRKAVITK